MNETDDLMEKLYPFIVDIQTSLDRYFLYMITVSLLKLSVGNRDTMCAILEKWIGDFFNANSDSVQERMSGMFGTVGSPDDIAPLHIIALQSVTNVVKKTLFELIDAIEGGSAAQKDVSHMSH